MKLEIAKRYFKENRALNFILILALTTILIFPLLNRLIANLDCFEVYSYYLQTFVNISLGFIVSLLFYIIVVFIPETRRKITIKGKTHIVFARLQTSFSNYIEATLGAFNLETGNNVDILSEWKLLVEATDDVYTILNRDIDETEPNYIINKNSRNYLNLIVHNSTKILNLKKELVPFLMFLDAKEVDLYSEIEDLFIFENIVDLQNGMGVDGLFFDEFPIIIEIYNKIQMILTGKIRPLVYNKRIFN